MSIVKLVPGLVALIALLLPWHAPPSTPSGPELAAEVSLGPLPGELPQRSQMRPPWAATSVVASALGDCSCRDSEPRP